MTHKIYPPDKKIKNQSRSIAWESNCKVNERRDQASMLPFDIMSQVTCYLTTKDFLKLKNSCKMYTNLKRDKVVWGVYCQEILDCFKKQKQPPELIVSCLKSASHEEHIKALRYLSFFGRLDDLKKLIELGVDPSEQDNIALFNACMGGFALMVDYLLNHPRWTKRPYLNNALLEAAKRGKTEVVKVFLKTETLFSSLSFHFALNEAATYGHLDCLEVMLGDPRIDPSYDHEL